jgi:hypothetical protein
MSKLDQVSEPSFSWTPASRRPRRRESRTFGVRRHEPAELRRDLRALALRTLDFCSSAAQASMALPDRP